MAKADTKELAQCLAFAYFAENPTYNKNTPEMENEHATGFYSLFSGKASVADYKTKYLSSQFPIDLVKKEFAVGKTPKSGAIKYNNTARTVYNVAKYCLENKLIPGGINNLKNYEFLDQNDPFVLLIKDRTLEKVIKAFSLTYSINILSAVDVFFVLKTAKKKIEKEFVDNFATPEIILKNSIWGDKGVDDYAGLMNKYMNSGELLPISLKLPNTVASPVHMKKTQFFGTDMAIEIDPYIKFLSAILANPSSTKEIIGKVIEIDTNKFSVGQKLNWVFPVNFNYTNLKEDGISLAKYNLRFNLFAQGHGAGWNGQFDKSTAQHQGTQWVGGLSSNTFEEFAKGYPEYNRVIQSVVDRRVKILQEMGDVLQKDKSLSFDKFKVEFGEALNQAKKKKILSIKESSKINRFFTLIGAESGESSTLFQTFLTRYIDATRGKSIKYVRAISKKGVLAKLTVENKTEAHYVHAQISECFFHGGVNAEMYFKQKMFLTIFGSITKKAQIKIDDYVGMKNAIQKEIINEKTKLLAEFTSAPHYIIS